MSGHSKKKTEDSSLIIPEKVKPLYKNGKSDFIGDVKGDVYPILYLSGSSGAHGITEEKLTEVADSRFRCFSFAYTGKASPVYAKAQAKAMDYCMQHGHRVFLDSGAHTFHNFRYKQKGGASVRHLTKAERNAALDKLMEDFVLGYAAYVRECYVRGYKFDFYVTFDAEKRCALIRKMTDQLFELGIHPVPAYHGDASLDWLRRYIDEGHKIIGVGTSRAGKHNQTDIRRYYATVIDLCEKHKVKCHGFAITGDSMFQFPWFCFTPSHQVLTKDGWKYHSQVRVGTEVLAFNNGVAQWEAIQKLHLYDVADVDLSVIASRKVSAETTMNHRWKVIRPRGRTAKLEYDVVTSAELDNSRIGIPLRGEYEGASHKLFSDELVKLAAWVFTEGTMRSGEIGIYQKTPRFVKRVQALLDEMGIAYTRSKGKDGCYSFRLRSQIVRNVLESILDRKNSKKISSSFLLALAADQLRLFVKEAVYGDGAVRSINCSYFSQKSGPRSKSFQLAVVLAGYALSVRSVKGQDSMCIRSLDSTSVSGKVSTKKYTGQVWCPSVPSGALFIKHKGRVYVSGNSVDSTTWLKSAAYGKIIEVVPERQRVSLVHVSTRHTQQGYGVIENLSPEVQKGLRNRVEKQGFDFEELRTNLGYRALYNARQYVIAVRVNAKKPLRFASWKSVL